MIGIMLLWIISICTFKFMYHYQEDMRLYNFKFQYMIYKSSFYKNIAKKEDK